MANGRSFKMFKIVFYIFLVTITLLFAFYVWIEMMWNCLA